MHTRRHFLRVVMVGGAAAGIAGCPRHEQAAADAGATAAAVPDAGAPLAKKIAGETFERCHAVRDHLAIATASDVSATHEVVVIGGGPSGLSAAYRLRDRDVLLLEKEPVLGGNCTFDQWEGVRMSNGGAFYTLSEKKLVELFKEIGAEGLPVAGTDALVINGEPVTDFFRDGAQKLALPQNVRDDFRRSRDDLVKLFKTKKENELDAIPFAKLLEPYASEVRVFWDRFGKSNWGADAENTSGYIGSEAYTWAGGMEDPRWTFPGGLAGGAAKLGEVVGASLKDRVVTGASVFRIDREGKGSKERAVVHYVASDGSPRAVRARAVILAVPKFFAKLIIPGLAEKQIATIKDNKYEPFGVFNVCLNGVGPEPAYDNWFLDTPFTDFVPADWIIHAGHGPKDRKTVLTVYYPLKQEERAFLLIDDAVLNMADAVAEHLERHFPGTMKMIEEIRVYRRGHAMVFSSPGRFAWMEKACVPCGPVFFAHTDSGPFASFDGALEAADKAVAKVRAHLKRA